MSVADNDHKARGKIRPNAYQPRRSFTVRFDQMNDWVLQSWVRINLGLGLMPRGKKR